jgi:hypothetical protein
MVDKKTPSIFTDFLTISPKVLGIFECVFLVGKMINKSISCCVYFVFISLLEVSLKSQICDRNTLCITTMLCKCIVIMVAIYKNPKLTIVMFS